MLARMNKGFAKHWNPGNLDLEGVGVRLEDRLRTLLESPLVRKGGCLVLEALATNASGREVFEDATAYEAFVNKFHVEDFVDNLHAGGEGTAALARQGVAAAVSLARRLEQLGPYRVLLSIDVEIPTAVVRFFERRQGEPWGPSNPEALQHEDLLMIDTNSPEAGG